MSSLIKRYAHAPVARLAAHGFDCEQEFAALARSREPG